MPTPVRIPVQTLASAICYVETNIDDGVICPCCQRWVHRREIRLDSSLARSLIWLVRRFLQIHGWVDVPETAPRWFLKTNVIGKLRYWGMVESLPNDNPDQKKSGVWRPTKLGVDFVYGRALASSCVHVFNDQVERRGTIMVNVTEALGKRFSYAELMGRTS